MDSDPDNNTATADTTVTTLGDLTVTKSADETVVAGTSMDYTVTVTNSGPSTSLLVEITDLLPTGTTFDSTVSASLGTFDGTTWSIPVLPAGTETLIFTVNVAASVPVGTVLTN